jgi:predicted nucleic acid-binding protein
MTLIDTSAWIEFLRREGDRQVKGRVASLIDLGEAAVCGPVEFELLVGARASERADLQEAISLCHPLEFTLPCWRRAADLERELRTKGVTVPRDDVFVAAAALTHQVPLLACDSHFELMRSKGSLALELA